MTRSAFRITRGHRRAAAVLAAVLALPVLLVGCGDDGSPSSIRSDEAEVDSVPATTGTSPAATDPAATAPGETAPVDPTDPTETTAPAEPTDPTDPGADPSAVITFAPTLSFADDPSRTAAATVLAETGGSVSVTAADGTVFTLDVPPSALAADTTITVTALDGIAGIDPVIAVHGVRLEPEGLQFIGSATLHVVPASDVPLDHLLAFQAAGDGSAPQLAFVDAETEGTAADGMTVLVPHFSGVFVAQIDAAIETVASMFTSPTPSQQIQSDMVSLVRIRDAYRTQGRDTAEVDRRLAEQFTKFLVEVVGPAAAAKDGSCDQALDAAKATSDLLYEFELFKPSSAFPSPRALAELSFLNAESTCEKARITECIAKVDHAILRDFWRHMRQWRKRFEYAPKPDDNPADYDLKAGRICLSYAYSFTGGLQDFQVVDVVICDVRLPFQLVAPGVGVAEFHGGAPVEVVDTGSVTIGGGYTATGEVIDFSYVGTYTISLPDGPGKPGTMTASSSGTIEDTGGSGTETYTLAPAKERCP